MHIHILYSYSYIHLNWPQEKNIAIDEGLNTKKEE